MLIRVDDIQKREPCKSAKASFFRATGLRADQLPEEISIGDVASANGLDDALWCFRLLPARIAIRAVLRRPNGEPATILRAMEGTLDPRLQEAASALEAWTNGREVDLSDIRQTVSEAKRGANSPSQKECATALLWAIVWAMRWKETSGAFSAGLWAAGQAIGRLSNERLSASDWKEERAEQLADILASFPPTLSGAKEV